ncbi:MAG: lytic transglycosylase domain-containing protein [Thermodesulfobacteriota bacterium]
MRVLPYIIVFMVPLLVPVPAAADIYSYTDENGVVHITNVPTSSKFKLLMRERGSRGNVDTSIERAIKKASGRYGVDEELIRAVIKAESNFDTNAVSRRGARGLMQLMPDTAKEMGVSDVHNPSQNIDGGVKYLRKMLDKFKWNVRLALAAYNAGAPAVRKYGKVPPYKETRLYVAKVLRYHKQYMARG